MLAFPIRLRESLVPRVPRELVLHVQTKLPKIAAARRFNRPSCSLSAWLLIAIFCAVACGGQNPETPAADGPTTDDPAVTMFPHSKTARWWVSGQDNIISQWHPSFAAKYSGPNSFRSQAEHATSNVGTLFTGLQLTHTTEIFMHFESA